MLLPDLRLAVSPSISRSPFGRTERTLSKYLNEHELISLHVARPPTVGMEAWAWMTRVAEYSS